MISTYDTNQGSSCQPVLLLIDEAGRTAIPSLADYGKARAQVLRDNMENQIYHRPTDLSTAQYLELRCGKQSTYAHSTTEREGAEVQEGHSEQPIPLVTAQDILQLSDEEIICFHRRLPPFKISRMDWRHHPTLIQRRNIPAPQLFPLPQLADLPPEISQTFRFPHEYIDSDMLN